MDLQDFKAAAMLRGNYYDNRQNASKAWARSWGLTYWRNIWFYKEYHVGNMLYRAGQIHGRHGGFRYVECEIDGKSVTEYRFRKVLQTFVAPPITEEEQARRSAYLKEIEQKAMMRKNALRQRRRRMKTDNSRQLQFSFV